MSRFDMTLEMYLELGAGLRLKRGYIVISPLSPPPCHHVITRHLLADTPLPCPSSDYVIYEQPL